MPVGSMAVSATASSVGVSVSSLVKEKIMLDYCLRGGSFYYYDTDWRSAIRFRQGAEYCYDNFGFRLMFY